eukprot:CAMPEP_0198237442 /NCGR_PEP_ID=MMETSP1446-20131203/3294_1 /TAXON_ID=1461542 ORGANISM="Unidentified sp, Strain CCMP2111" /NCGR_SAMPLE_ID=MMETSP1446 /ASSEMBLY_ACC=CAM_ASM_001112 /LENGTH=634 /DNA_ID=CAMNT_0043919609 /DNA_START=207 /DNA_END=2114 /DNA_ORIENTATION=-
MEGSREEDALGYLDDRELLDCVHGNTTLFRNDSKDFVDMPMKRCAETRDRRGGDEGGALSLRKARERIVRQYSSSSSGSSGDPQAPVTQPSLDATISDMFGHPGSDLVSAIPVDWRPVSLGGSGDLNEGDIDDGTFAATLRRLKCSHVKQWAIELHNLWPKLCRKVSADVLQNPSHHTLLPMPHELFIPGDRFREQYYWDSYFVAKGLLVSGMVDSCIGMARNLLHCISRYGFVPNGTRSYYLRRTQPPLLSQILIDLLHHQHKQRNDARHQEVLSLLSDALPRLVEEHHFVTSKARNRSVKVKASVDNVVREFDLVRYYAASRCPRPEAHLEDMATVAQLPPQDSMRAWREIATMAESGWDFSSRWLRDPLDLGSARITDMLPSDLNAIVAKMEANIAEMASLVGDSALEREYHELSLARREAIDCILWDEESSRWNDVIMQYRPEVSENDTDGGGHNADGGPGFVSMEDCTSLGGDNVYASSWVPLWVPTPARGDRARKAIESLKKSGLVMQGGIVTSTNQGSSHQWDHPNAWAPLQYMIVEGLMHHGDHDLARDIASRFLKNAFTAYRVTGQMHEKYNAVYIGEIGKGGEYEPQTGFGWTNGVCLAFIDMFGDTLDFSECITAQAEGQQHQ